VPDLELDRESGTPLHQQLAARLRSQILSGEIPPDRAIPSKADIHQQTGLANRTIDKALQVLKAEGLIESRKGMGMFVLPEDQRRPR
jgi:DNA-binding GntR family transcriptional regulator